MAIETLFHVALIAKMARREKQIQQHYRKRPLSPCFVQDEGAGSF